MRRPIMPTHHLSSSSASMRPVHTYPDWSYLVGILNRVASSDDHVDSTTLASMPWVIALDGEDSIEYSRRIAAAAAAAAAGAGAPPSVMAVPVESAGEQDRGKPELLAHLLYQCTDSPFSFTGSPAYLSPIVPPPAPHVHVRRISCQYVFNPSCSLPWVLYRFHFATLSSWRNPLNSIRSLARRPIFR